MAEALEDEATVLYRRAAAFEEDEFILTREIEERQTEINRLLLKLDAMRAERDRVIEKVESIFVEANAMRDEALNPGLHTESTVESSENAPPQVGNYFRRASVPDRPV